jgi:hypothetical protein
MFNQSRALPRHISMIPPNRSLQMVERTVLTFDGTAFRGPLEDIPPKDPKPEAQKPLGDQRDLADTIPLANFWDSPKQETANSCFLIFIGSDTQRTQFQSWGATGK